jgi:hypothetical protein
LGHCFFEAGFGVSFIQEEEHAVVFGMSNESAKTLIDRSDGAVEVPFLPIYARSVFIPASSKLLQFLKVLFALDNERILDIGKGNSNEDYSSTMMVRKINAFTGPTSTNAIQNGSMFRLFFELFNITFSSPFFKYLLLDSIHPLSVLPHIHVIADFSQGFEVGANDEHTIGNSSTDFENGFCEFLVDEV